ncbi:MAG: hypothetical protein L6266_06200 [Nanoarchaeota archaeon]|nr:hypothetical protein [Nanoarchaeota archaeon]
MNLDICFKEGEEIVKIIAETGRKNFASHDVSKCEVLENISEKVNKRQELTNQEKELLTNFLYLNVVMDQGRDPEGVKQLLIQVTNKAYNEGINFLQYPNQFFKNPRFFTKTLKEEHEKVKEVRARISGLGSRYNLFDTKINPYTMHRWGTVMLCLKKLYEDNRTLLSFIKNSGRADNIPEIIRNDNEYGLGNAIGYKACRLLIKWLIHTFPIIKDRDLRWGPNSYEIPLDSNVGGVFMRSGLLFLVATEDDLWSSKCWIEQTNKRINLSAQRLNDLRIPEGIPIENELQSVLSSWGVRKRNLMKLLNAFVVKLNNKEYLATIGQLDDGFMYIGQKYCKNEGVPLCEKCPLSNVCLSNNKEALLKTQYYCGTGVGVFFGR